MKIKIPVKDLQLNTVVANNVYNQDFHLLITKGTILTRKVLDRLTLFNVEYVYIDKEQEEEKSFTDTKEFQTFKSKYLDISDDLQNSLNKIVTRSITSTEIRQLVDNCMKLYNSGGTSYGIFDMLHHMRDFSDVTFVHSINVGMIASIIGKWAGKSEEDEHILMACGLLHDIGKMLIPIDILNKPGKLTNDEYAVIKTHAMLGYELLKDLNIDDRIKKCALLHHERIDGSGYPYGYVGNEIDDFAKIITIADVYDALTANRVYRGPICPFDVIELFEKEGYHLYDTRYLLTFLQNIINSYLHSEVVLTNGSKGDIIMINTNTLSKPVVYSGDQFLDLSKSDVRIKQILSE